MRSTKTSRRPVRSALAAAALLITAVSMWGLATLSGPARAQIDIGHTVPSVIGVGQNGKLVGLAWADGGEITPCVYNEYWYLTPAYVYPGSPGVGQSIKTEQRVLRNSPDLETPEQFFNFARVRLGDGKRIVMSVTELEFCGANGFSG